VWGRILLLVCLTSCDYLFQLEHLDGSDAMPIDAPACPAPTGATATKQFGARSGATETPSTDTFISDDDNQDTHNFGSLDKLFVCYQCSCTTDCESISGGDDDVRTLLRFELAAGILPCSRVDRAILYLNTTDDNLGGGSSVVVYALTESWTEGTGALATGTEGTASWNERMTGLPWVDDGAGPGSRIGTEIARFQPTGTNMGYAVDLTEGVQRWVNAPANNHGMVLVVTGSTSDVHFFSRESADASRRPGLVVTYTAP
jgi:hypothetical protein